MARATYGMPAAAPASTTEPSPVATAASARRSRHAVHVNFEWRCLAEVTYPCIDPAAHADSVISVRRQNQDGSLGELEAVPCNRMLKTQALSRSSEELLRCHHYDFKGCCRRGERCAFVHVVTISASLEGPRARRRMRARDRSGQQHTPTSVSSSDVCLRVRVDNGRWWYRDPYQCTARIHLTPFSDTPVDESSESRDVSISQLDGTLSQLDMC